MCPSDLDQDSTVQILNSELSPYVLCACFVFKEYSFPYSSKWFWTFTCDNYYEGKHYDVFHHFHSSDRITSDHRHNQVFGGSYSNTSVTPSPFATKKKCLKINIIITAWKPFTIPKNLNFVLGGWWKKRNVWLIHALAVCSNSMIHFLNETNGDKLRVPETNATRNQYSRLFFFWKKKNACRKHFIDLIRCICQLAIVN